MVKPKLRVVRPQAASLEVGQMVMTPRGVGMLVGLSITAGCPVQFGASGPTQEFSWRILRHATAAEIEEAGLTGVGRKPSAVDP